MSSTEQLLSEAGRIRESGVLGDARLRQLFDYLLDKTLAGESPKELVIAMDVFGKGADFHVGEDALVRVYMHKLRKALMSFYGPAPGTGYSLQLPKGDYRLHLRQPATATAPSPAVPAVSRRLWPRRLSVWLLCCSALAVLAVVLVVLKAPGRQGQDDLAAVRGSPMWSQILADERPITIVLGDYYLVGETDDTNEVKRLIREFDINSRTDLDRHRMQHPDESKHLVDVGFRYLPTASANALRHVMAVLAPADRRISVRMMSQLPVSTFKSSDVVYIGFVSGMGMLHDLVFTGSRLRVGDSYDELVDTKTGRGYVSQEGSQVDNGERGSDRGSPYHDYGLFAKLRGPAGNLMLIIAGTRDEGVQETSEKLTNPADLKGIASRVDTAKPFEGLLEVGALNGVDMSGRVIFAAPRS
jgi:hypothetical protein